MYPLTLEPFLRPMVWGGRKLETHLGKPLPTDQPYGESWEIFWQNRVTNGPFAGRTLGEVITAQPEAMTGRADATAEFPLLVKFLDAEQWLSVQVHPDDAKALELEGEPRGKTECWYIIDAEPGAQLAYGLCEALDAAGFRAAVASGRARNVLQYVPVAAGDFIFVPAGTQHAIGPGILLYELQQTSDTTYRVYDWDRVGLDGKPRDLHLDKALAVTNYTVNPPATRPYTFEHNEHAGYSAAELMRGQYFSLDLLNITQQCPRDTGGVHAHLLSAIRGAAEIRGVGFAPVPLPAGSSAFIPAIVGRYHLVGNADVLCAW